MRSAAMVVAFAWVGCSSNPGQSPSSPGVDVASHALAAVQARPHRLEGATVRSKWLEAQLPAVASDPLLLATADGRYGLRLQPLGVPAVTGRRTPEALVFSTAPGAELLYAHVGQRVEELRVLHGRHAPHRARYRVEPRGAASTLRLREGRLELVDASGRVQLDCAPVFALDSKGRRLAVNASLTEGGDATYFDLEVPTQPDEAYPVTVDPAWGAGGSMTEPNLFVAARLGSGKVLAAGASAELYDPATNTWSAAGTIPDPDYFHMGSVVLASGKVLVVGGAFKTTRLYDPTTNSWSTGAPMPLQRNAGIVELLPSGRVLYAGGEFYPGSGEAKHPEAWEFDPVANSWAAVGSMNYARDGAMSCALADGRVLVTGGYTDSTHLSVDRIATEIYNPTTKTFSVTGNRVNGAAHPYGDSHCVRLSSGAILAGDLYNPTSGTWSATGFTLDAAKVQAITLPSGLVGGFNAGGGAALFNPTTSTWTALPAPIGGYDHYSHVSLGDNRVLAVGGPSLQPQILYALDKGQTCSGAAQCLSGYCADGVCCDAACAGACVACNLTGKVGTCSAVTAGSTPAAGHPSCAPYATCGAGGACPTACTADTDCTSGNYCDDTTKKCTAKKGNGTTCGRVGECTSANCIDKVCCNVACTGQCEACDAAGSVGTCKAVSGVPHGTRTACSSGTGKTCELQFCDGVKTTGCSYPPVSTTCSGNACTSGIETHASTCDGAGACKDVPKDCGAYKCGATACKTTCTTKADCIAGYSCVGGACTPSIGLGKPCSDASACGDLLCVDGVCCGVDAPATKCADGYACNAPGKEGTCTLKNGSKCDLGSKCGSGNCVDGVCCDKACDGQCEACDVTGAVGTCTGVAGAPHGSRPACDAGGTGPDVCKARTCNGAADTKSCVGYVNDSSKLCAPKKCVGSDFSDFSFCDGAGTCKSPGASSCVPYKCDDTGCLKACTSGEQCADGFQCKDGKCVQGATCKDATTSVSKDGKEEPCGAYRCTSTGACGKECVSTDNCAPGYACDGRACVPVAASSDTGDSGGCVVGAPRPGSPVRAASFVLFGLVALGAARRRRR